MRSIVNPSRFATASSTRQPLRHDLLADEQYVYVLLLVHALLGTREIILIHHTDCGMLTFTDDEFKRSVQDEHQMSQKKSAVEAFPELDEDVRQSIARIKASRSSRTPTRCAASCST